MTRILLHGAGRMARRVARQTRTCNEFELLGLVARSEPANVQEHDYYAALDEIDRPVDLLIDFTLPGGTRVAAQWCGRKGVALLSGTTGLSVEDTHALELAASKVPVLWAPNMSHGVALMTRLVRQVARDFGAGAKIKIRDIHHKHKVDAPSGTALTLGEEVKAGLAEPPTADLEFASVREGELVSEHTVSFTAADEVVEITHKALNRDVFARGALKAGAWLVNQRPGYYTTSDWLKSA